MESIEQKEWLGTKIIWKVFAKGIKYWEGKWAIGLVYQIQWNEIFLCLDVSLAPGQCMWRVPGVSWGHPSLGSFICFLSISKEQRCKMIHGEHDQLPVLSLELQISNYCWSVIEIVFTFPSPISCGPLLSLYCNLWDSKIQAPWCIRSCFYLILALLLSHLHW